MIATSQRVGSNFFASAEGLLPASHLFVSHSFRQMGAKLEPAALLIALGLSTKKGSVRIIGGNHSLSLLEGYLGLCFAGHMNVYRAHVALCSALCGKASFVFCPAPVKQRAATSARLARPDLALGIDVFAPVRPCFAVVCERCNSRSGWCCCVSHVW